jgi:hypothetical protein
VVFYTCSPDFNVYEIGVVTCWTPVKNLTFRLDQTFAGSSVLAVAAPKPATVYEFKDQNAVSLQLRVQRNF